MRVRTLSPILAGLLALVAPGARTQETPPTFRSEAQVVVLDVVATDGKGRPVGDLKPGEVQVFEDGKACEVLAFRLVRAATSAGEAPAIQQAVPSEQEPPASPAAPTPTRASLVVLLFDRLTTPTAPLARKGALDLVSQSFPPDTWFAVFKVGYGVRLLTAFTTDRDRLRASIEAATFGDSEKGPVSLGPTLPPVRLEAELPPDALQGPDNVRVPDLRVVAPDAASEELALAGRNEGYDSLYALLGVARALGRVEGRKSVVYFAEGWHLPLGTQPVYDDAVSAANRANVAIHIVDARGLVSQKPLGLTLVDSVVERFTADHRLGPGQGASTPPIEANGGLATGGMATRGIEHREEQLSGPRLERLAEDTGGLAITSTNDLGAGLARVAEELRQYYEVVYAPADAAADGRFRHIAVRVSRQGVHLRTRSGYFATPGRSPSVVAYELPLIDALAADPPAHDFTVRAGVLHFAPKGPERECEVLAEVPLSEVHVTSDEPGGAYRAHLTLLAYVKDEGGRVVARLTHDWPIEGPLGQREAARGQSAFFRSRLSLAPGRYVLETAVQDRQTGARSVFRTPFEVPAAERGLALASVVVPSRAVASGSVSPGSDPLRVGDVSLVPGLGAPFQVGERSELPIYVNAYPALRTEPVRLTVEVRREGAVVAEASPLLSPPADAAGTAAWMGGIPTARLSPGSYEVAVTAEQGDATAREAARFEIDADRGLGKAGSQVPEPPDPELAPILERAGRYVVAYQDSLRNIVAEERYVQKARGAVRGLTGNAAAPVMLSDGSELQTTRADLVFVRLADDVPWGLFRDVFEVNGTRVRDRDERLEKLFREPSPSSLEQARRILEESARYNIGPRRTVNLPTLALLFLHPRNQPRFSFKEGGRRSFEGFEGVEVEFEEVRRPALTQDEKGGDVPVNGRFWIDPSRGTVMRSETRYRFEPSRARGFVSAEYRLERRLGMWVPAEMKERYEDVAGNPEPVFRHPAEATARYSNYRRFTVTIEDERATVPGGAESP